jgi:DNA-binding CsgD family transcriptional regulator
VASEGQGDARGERARLAIASAEFTGDVVAALLAALPASAGMFVLGRAPSTGVVIAGGERRALIPGGVRAIVREMEPPSSTPAPPQPRRFVYYDHELRRALALAILSCCPGVDAAHAVALFLCDRGATLGVVALFRGRAEAVFSGAEVEFLDRVAETIVAGARLSARAAPPPLSPAAGTERASSRNPRFSRRELMVADLLLQGYGTVNVAAILALTDHTVRTYVRRIYRKLGVHSRADFVREVMVRGLMPPVSLRPREGQGAPKPRDAEREPPPLRGQLGRVGAQR